MILLYFWAFLAPGGESNPYTLVQYLFEQENHTVQNLALHGNSKRKQPYRRLLPIMQDKLKQSTESLKNPKVVLDEIYSSSGNVYHARSLNELPRGPRDIYNTRAAAKRVQI